MRERLWIVAARMPVPGWLSLSWLARAVDRWLTKNYLLQRKALLLVPWNTRVLLDVGCGGAAYLECCQVPRIIGVDANEKRLGVARNYCDEVRRCDLEEGLPEIRADCVLCLEVVEHLSREAGLWLLERLASYPVAVVSTPREFFRVSRDSFEAHLSFWGEEEMEALGFSLMERVTTPPSNIYVRRGP